MPVDDIKALTKLVPVPKPGTINTDLNSFPLEHAIAKHGPPRIKADDKRCWPITNSWWKQHMSEVLVPPLGRVYGFTPFLEVLREGFEEVRVEEPLLYSVLGTEGCTCCRYVRGTVGHWSDHAFGCAIDMTIAGILDTRGDKKVLAGTLLLYSILKRHLIYWGAGYRIEDGMHYGASTQLIHKFEAQGKF